MDAPLLRATEVAIKQIKHILDEEQLTDQAVRVGIGDRSPTGFQ